MTEAVAYHSIQQRSVCESLGCDLLCLLGLKKKPGSAIRQTRVIKKSWRRATLPQGQPCNTIAASELNFCVRNGNRCGLAAINTSKMLKSDLLNLYLSSTAAPFGSLYRDPVRGLDRRRLTVIPSQPNQTILIKQLIKFGDL